VEKNTLDVWCCGFVLSDVPEVCLFGRRAVVVVRGWGCENRLNWSKSFVTTRLIGCADERSGKGLGLRISEIDGRCKCCGGVDGSDEMLSCT
jgi:hypothetical protein